MWGFGGDLVAPGPTNSLKLTRVLREDIVENNR